MELNSKAMQGVPVRTQGGQHVGKVASFDLDADTGRLHAIRVKAAGLVPGLMNDELIVAWSAVISMGEHEVVVADAGVGEGAKAIARSAPAAVAPTLMSEG